MFLIVRFDMIWIMKYSSSDCYLQFKLCQNIITMKAANGLPTEKNRRSLIVCNTKGRGYQHSASINAHNCNLCFNIQSNHLFFSTFLKAKH